MPAEDGQHISEAQTITNVEADLPCQEEERHDEEDSAPAQQQPRPQLDRDRDSLAQVYQRHDAYEAESGRE